MKTTKRFKIGDRVIVRPDDDDRLNDFEADMTECLRDRSITGRVYDAIWKGITDRLPFTITKVNKESDGGFTYEARVGTAHVPFCLADTDLKPFEQQYETQHQVKE